MSAALRLATTLSLPAVLPALTLAAAPVASAASIPAPPTKTLPTEVDVAPPYLKQVLCDPTPKPGPVAFAKLLNSHYGTRYYGIGRACASDVSEHYEGRALDWMISAKDPSQLALANSILTWLTSADAKGNPGAMARRFGINYIVWNGHQWRAYAPERGWAVYTGSNPHTDHIHITFTWDGAFQRTSWWTGVALTTISYGPPTTTPAPTTTGYPVLKQGSLGPDVITIQKIVGTTADGDFGPKTAAAVSAWRTGHGLSASTTVDDAMWTKLIALGLVPKRTTTPTTPTTPTAPTGYPVLKQGSRGADVSTIQKIVGTTADGDFGPKTAAAVTSWRSGHGLSATAIVEDAMWAKLIAMGLVPKRTASTATGYPVLSLGSKGADVVTAQKAVGAAPDGDFGPLTAAAVISWRSSHGLSGIAKVDDPMWTKLIALKLAPARTTTTTPTTPTTTATTTEFTPYRSTTLKIGSTGAAVKLVQRTIGGLTVDGIFGSRTAAAVSAFRTSRGLSAGTTVDAATWKALELKAHPLVPYWATVLRKGSTGPAVVALQKGLRISADGIFGSQTEAAVKALQTRAKLSVTGVMGTNAWQALEREVLARS